MISKMQLALFGLILAIGLIISTYLVTDVIRDVRLSHQIIKVRGYAEKIVESDLAIWEIYFGIRSENIKKGYPVIEDQKKQVLAFLKEQGVDQGEIHIFSMSINEQNKLDENANITNEIDFFQLQQIIEITSSDVHKIAGVSSDITQLLKTGIAIQSSSPNYYYSKVNDLKSELLTEATQDARMRAQTLATGSGVKLGFLKAARQGSFSIRSAKSTNISSEDTYDDTYSITKKITAIVTVDYSMK
ncbi:hypothetical protein ES707_05754 [subsurface metagenome]